MFQSTNEAVFAVEFNPNDSTNIITCGKSHIYFWTLSSGQFTKKQGIFGVRPPGTVTQCCIILLISHLDSWRVSTHDHSLDLIHLVRGQHSSKSLWILEESETDLLISQFAQLQQQCKVQFRRKILIIQPRPVSPGSVFDL